MKQFFRDILSSVTVVIIATLIGLILLYLVHLLPVSPMQDNIARSSELYNYEGVYPQWDTGYKATQLDNWTETLVLAAAIYDGGDHSLTERVFYVPYMEYDDLSMPLSLTNYANHSALTDYHEANYDRYWHGSIVLLKPLLLFFDMPDIRMICMLLTFFLLILTVIQMKNNHIDLYIPAFLFGMAVYMPVTTGLSTIFTAETVTMQVLSLLILKSGDEAGKRNWVVPFALTGCLTSFLGELSFPVVSLGFPLLFLAWQRSEKLTAKRFFTYSAAWGIGYFLNWILKWLLGTLLTERDFIQDNIRHFLSYHEDKVGYDLFGNELVWEPGLFMRSLKNLLVVTKWPFILLFLGITAYYICVFVKRGYAITRESAKGTLVPLLIGCLPFLLYFALGNGYSYVHYWMSYRQLSVTAAAAFGALICLGTGGSPSTEPPQRP